MTEAEALDAIATMLGTAQEWYPASDFLDGIVGVINEVRPNVGTAAGEDYKQMFLTAMHREVLPAYDMTLDQH
jgi:hypothetical protein